MSQYEPERYELAAAPIYDFELARREFFGLLGGGIVIISLLQEARGQESGGGRRGRGGHGVPAEIGAWIHLDEDGRVTIYTGKAEVGQNIRTSLTQVVADELRIPMSRIHLVMGDTDLTPYDAGTFGSRTTPDMASRLRKVAAAAREMLLDLAAEQWKVDRSSLSASDGKISSSATGKSVSYQQLTKGQKLMKAVPDSAVGAPAEQWTVAGKSASKVNGRAFVTGQHKFSADVHLENTLYGKVLRAPAYGATMISVDTKAAEAMAGVTVVHDGDFVGVAAPSPERAAAALAAIRAEWTTTPQISSLDLFESFKPVDKSMAKLDNGLRERYTIAYIAHIPLEPRAAAAEWKDGRLTVWTGTQRPFGVQSELAQAFHIPEGQVHVIVPDTGSGYGGKHTGEAALEAARLAAGAHRPVKLLWTREEEFTWAYVRPAGVIEVASRLGNDGRITDWEFHNYNSGGSAIRSLYDIPGQKSEFHQTKSPLRQGSYRGLAATANHFARESHMDELAHLAGMDPLEFRLKNLKDDRLRAVLEAAAKGFGWKNRGRGVGIAGGSEKGSYVASVAEVSMEGGTPRIRRVVTAFECGAILNPDHLKEQVEGAVIMGIGGALFEALEFEDGKMLNSRLSKYRVPRFSDVPKLETVLLDRKDLASVGAGETPIVALAPAVANAIFDATGQRIRSMPLAPKGFTRTG